MKIVIIGYSGSGKSTLAKTLGTHYNIPVLHLDSVHFEPGWVERKDEEANEIVKQFIKDNESWIIDGNYRKLAPKRFELSDEIIFLNYNRFTCLKGVIKRYFENKGKTRSDMTVGCDEKLDFTFLWWVFSKGRSKERRNRLMSYTKSHKNAVIFRNRKELNKYLKNMNIENN